MSAKCCVCTDEFSGIDDLEAHISADHYNCLPFECEKCKFAKFPTEFAIKRHYEEDHGLVEYFVYFFSFYFKNVLNYLDSLSSQSRNLWKEAKDSWMFRSMSPCVWWFWASWASQVVLLAWETIFVPWILWEGDIFRNGTCGLSQASFCQHHHSDL